MAASRVVSVVLPGTLVRFRYNTTIIILQKKKAEGQCLYIYVRDETCTGTQRILSEIERSLLDSLTTGQIYLHEVYARSEAESRTNKPVNLRLAQNVRMPGK